MGLIGSAGALRVDSAVSVPAFEQRTKAELTRQPTLAPARDSGGLAGSTTVGIALGRFACSLKRSSCFAVGIFSVSYI